MKPILPSLIMLCGILLSACSTLFRAAQPPSQGPDAANGERIYFTGSSGRPGQITYTEGPNFGGMMMGSYLTCASCHGPEGQGGRHQMHMTVMDAPDIRYSALNTMPEMEDSQRPYGLPEFKLAVEEGQEPNGEALDDDMPRWHMSEADLQDLFAFLGILQ